MDKEVGVLMYNGILLSHEKERNLTIYDNLGGPWGHYTKWKNSEKDKYYIISLIYRILKKKKTHTKNKTFKHTENRLVIIRGRGWGMGEVKKFLNAIYF